MAEVPDWLQGDAQVPSSHVASSSTPSSFTEEGKPTPTDFVADGEVDTTKLRGQGCGRLKIVSIVLYMISVVFVALLVYSFVTNLNDGSHAILWLLYYSFHAALALVFMLERLFAGFGRLGTKVLILLSLLMLGFTGVMLWFSVDSWKDANSEDDGEDQENKNEKEETTLEISGAAFGGLCLIYHLFVWYCAQRTRNEKDSTVDGGAVGLDNDNI